MPRSDTQFKPGNPGGPGRPKRKSFLEMLYSKLDKKPKNWEKMLEKTILMLTGGDKEMIKELWHYMDGLPKGSLEHSGKVDLDMIPFVQKANESKNNNSNGENPKTD